MDLISTERNCITSVVESFGSGIAPPLPTELEDFSFIMSYVLRKHISE